MHFGVAYELTILVSCDVHFLRPANSIPARALSLQQSSKTLESRVLAAMAKSHYSMLSRGRHVNHSAFAGEEHASILLLRNISSEISTGFLTDNTTRQVNSPQYTLQDL